jgi:hypothetical protein
MMHHFGQALQVHHFGQQARGGVGSSASYTTTDGRHFGVHRFRQSLLLEVVHRPCTTSNGARFSMMHHFGAGVLPPPIFG